jgi:hypothetical protein
MIEIDIKYIHFYSSAIYTYFCSGSMNEVSLTANI